MMIDFGLGLNLVKDMIITGVTLVTTTVINLTNLSIIVETIIKGTTETTHETETITIKRIIIIILLIEAKTTIMGITNTRRKALLTGETMVS